MTLWTWAPDAHLVALTAAVPGLRRKVFGAATTPAKYNVGMRN